MKLSVFGSYDQLSEYAAQAILQEVKTNPTCVLCLATGDSPKLTYSIFVHEVRRQRINIDQVHFIALDEWMGIPPSNPGSCHFFLRENLFLPLGVNDQNVHLFDSFARETKSECERMDQTIQKLGGVDVMLVGVGMNGHIGFNEPGVSETLHAHVIELDATTQQVGQKYFSEKTQLTKGITLGLANFFEAKKVLMVANGNRKAQIMHDVLEGKISTAVPASLVRKHSNAEVLIDQEAAFELSSKY
jgi:glucosamine-6-phosphate isomerase